MSVMSGGRPEADGPGTLPARGAAPRMRMRTTDGSAGRCGGTGPQAEVVAGRRDGTGSQAHGGRPVPAVPGLAPGVPEPLVPRPRVPMARTRPYAGGPGSAPAYRSAAAAVRPSRPHLRLVKPAEVGASRGAFPRTWQEPGHQPRRVSRTAETPQARYAGGDRPRVAVRNVAPGRRAGVRLTRRGRIVLAAFLICLALVAVGLTAAARAQAASSGTSAASLDRSMTRVVVQPGQTLWSIAVKAAPAQDPRVVMQRIVDVNALRGTTLQPGQQLWVPKG